MAMAASTPSPLAAPVVLDSALAHLRDHLRRFGRTHGFLHGHLCRCGRPECPETRVESMSLVSMLRAVATEWRDGPEPRREPLLRQRLLTFARAFRVLECPCGEADCPTTTAQDADTRTLLRVVADVWHGRAGNRVDVADTGEPRWPGRATEVMEWMAQRYARNAAALTPLALRLDPQRAGSFRSVPAEAERREGGAWLAEARAMAAEAIATWLPDAASLPEARRVTDVALAVAYHGGWTTGEAADFERAAADACSAVLSHGIVHESVSEALMAPFAGLVTLQDLDAAVDALLLADQPAGAAN
jgi:hypothetical protein